MLKNQAKAMTTLIAFILMITIAIPLTTLPTASAQIPDGMNWDLPQNPSTTRMYFWDRWQDQVPTHMFLVVAPNPVGVGQDVTVILMNPQVPPAAVQGNDIRWYYTATITKPDGTVENYPPPGATGAAYTHGIKDGMFVSDSTGSTFFTFVPTQTGNYTITGTFEELKWHWNADATQRNYYGVTLLESTYTVNLQVQNEPITPTSAIHVPLPTEYWARPIEGQNTEWHKIASNWLSGPHDRNFGGADNMFQPDGAAPDSGHILWTRPTEDGGLVGGSYFSVEGEVFNAGHQYQTRFTNPIIMHGRLYYEESIYWSGSGGGIRCIDLRTGEQLWHLDRSESGIGVPSFGYYYDYDDMNQHGIVNPGWIFTANFRNAIHPLHGNVAGLEIVNVPSGFEVLGDKGEHLRLVLSNAGNNTHPDWRLMQWNSSRAFHNQNVGLRPANVPTTPRPGNLWWNGSSWVSNADRLEQGYAQVSATSFDWNVSAPWHNTMTGGSITIRGVYGDVLIGSNGSHPVAPAYNFPQEVTFWAISLKSGQEGQLLWMKNIVTSTADNQNIIFRRAAEGVLLFVKTPYMSYVAYDMYTGNLLWETAPEADFNPFGYYGTASMYRVYENSIAYGMFFTAGYSGRATAYNLTDGSVVWQYEAPTGQSVFPYYTLMIGAIADEKIYLGTHEHSAQTPLFKGNLVRALDVFTGEEVWAHYGWANPQSMAVADGTLIYWNNYDHQIYAVGKGASSTTVSIQNDVVAHNSKVLITGSVLDVSAGTKQHEQAMRFPNGVAAISDDSMNGWMEYVYMQKPRPIDTVGVTVTINVLDSNNNFRSIGTAVSDADGFYSLDWTPDIDGKFTVYATFEGTNGYYGSQATTAFTVNQAPEAAPEQTQPPASVADMYFVPAVAGIIIAIIIGFALLALLMLRKRP